MLSLRHWKQGGWLSNYLLFVPQGYAKIVEHLDEPDLRHHAHGIAPGPGRQIGPRLRYTHYPSGYLIPYALLQDLGFDSLSAARWFSCALSVAALGLAFALFARLSSPAVAFASCVYYGLSPLFLGHADSIANQPTDDVLRFAFLLAIVLSTGAATAERRRNLLAVAWATEFLLSLCSFDSVFFVYVWLVGWDLLTGAGFRWRRYVVFGLAPLTAHSLQFLQNVWYLGLSDAYADVAGVFREVGMPGDRLRVTLSSLQELSQAAGWHPLPWLAAAGTYAALPRFARREGTDNGLPSGRVLLLLAICGLAYVAVLPGRAGMIYQGRQFLPALALLVGTLTVWPIRRAASKGWSSGRILSGGGVVVVAVLSVAAVHWASLASARPHPLYPIDPNDPDVALAKELRSFPAAHEPVFFNIEGFRHLYAEFIKNYPQVFPLLEYYVDSRPILSFHSPELLSRDMEHIVQHSETRFSPILISRNKDILLKTLSLLGEKGIIDDLPPGYHASHGFFVVDLTPYMNFRQLGRKHGGSSAPRLRPAPA